MPSLALESVTFFDLPGQEKERKKKSDIACDFVPLWLMWFYDKCIYIVKYCLGHITRLLIPSSPPIACSCICKRLHQVYNKRTRHAKVIQESLLKNSRTITYISPRTYLDTWSGNLKNMWHAYEEPHRPFQIGCAVTAPVDLVSCQ